MARDALGTKRVCPETGKKFYDLNKDPIVSPYTGKQYERSAFEIGDSTKTKPEEAVEQQKEEVEVTETTEEAADVKDDGPEIVSLEDADEDSDDDADSDDEEIPDLPEVELEVGEDDESDDDAFLDDEEDDDDLSNVIGDVDGEEEV